MNLFLRDTAFFFTSGDAFFVGWLFIFATTWIGTHATRFGRGVHTIRRIVLLLGGLFVVLSAVPVPTALCLVNVILAVGSLWLSRPITTTDVSRVAQRRRQTVWTIRAFLVSGIFTLGFEIKERWEFSPNLITANEIHIVGDSLSAGLGEPSEKTWPEFLADALPVPVFNHAQPGAGVRQALLQADFAADTQATVIVEIGGNDLLAGQPAREFERDFEALIQRLSNQHRTLVCFELPLPPFCNGYGRAQRDVARRYGVKLIPRRVVASIIFATDATTDGLHLTKQGHLAMAQAVQSVLHRATASPSTRN